MEEYSEFLFAKIQDSFFSGIMPQIPAFVLKDIEENTDGSIFSKPRMILGSILSCSSFT